MARLYEGMFLLDNRAVREDWKRAKALVTDTVEKHGGRVKSARRWDERRLAYPIQGRQRATYMLAYYEIDKDGIQPFVRDLELSEPILRHLILSAEAVPEKEIELARAEEAEGFSIPTPPEDDAQEPDFEGRGPESDGEGTEEGAEGERRPRRAEPAAEEASAETATASEEE